MRVRTAAALVLLLALVGCQQLAHRDGNQSGDGPAPRRLAYVHKGAIWLVDGDGRNPRQVVGDLLLNGVAQDRPITWSPDGSRILFWKHSEIGWDIWSAQADGSGVENLTRVESGGCRSPSFSPDGTRIAYMRDNPAGVYVMNADGSNPVRLSEYGFRDETPAWSPDGTRLAFVHARRDAEGRFGTELYLVEADGSDEVSLGGRLKGSVSAPFWSSNGRWIYFAGPRNENRDICFFDPDRGVELNLTESPARESYPVPDPDGNRIAFLAVDETLTRLMVMDSNGTNHRELATLQGRSWFPSWSPDGQRLAFMAQDGDGPPRIEVMNLDGSGRTEIAEGSFPSWQPRRQGS